MTDLSSLSDEELTALYQQKQIAPSGTTSDLSKMSDDELKAAYAASTKPAPDTSIGGAIAQGASSVVQGYGKTIKDYINKDAGAAVESAGAAKARPNYKSATEGFMRPEDGADKHTLGVDWSKLPRMLVEQAPALAVDLAAQKVGGIFGPIGRYAANALSFGGRTAGAEAERRAAERTGDPNAEPSTTDKLVGLGSTAVQTGLNQYGLNKILRPSKVTAVGLEGVKQGTGNVIKAGLAEGGTNAAQNLVSQGAAKAGTSGLDTIDWQEVKANAAAGTALGGTFSAPKGAREASIATRLRNSTDEHSVMAANRIKENGSVDAAKQDIHTELSRAAEGVTDPTPETDNAIVRAKSGGKLSSKDLDAIDAVGDEQLSSLVRQATALSKMSDKPGGLSGKAESLVKGHPWRTLSGVITPHAVAATGLFPAFATAIPAAGTLAAGAGLTYAGLRGFDSLMGLRDKGGVFAERIGDGTGKVRPDAPPPPPDVEPSDVKLLQAQHRLESAFEKIAGKVQNQKRKDVTQEALPLLRQLAARNKLMPEQPEPVREQVPPPAPVMAEPKSVDTRGATPQSPREGESIVQQALAAMQAQRAREQPQQEEFVLPESPHAFKDTKTASQDILAAAVAGGKEIRHAAGFKAGVKNRLDSEEAIYTKISDALASTQEQGDFHKYLSALWGSDSPEVVKQVRAHMIAEFPQHAETINKHLSDEAIRDLWTKPKKKKA